MYVNRPLNGGVFIRVRKLDKVIDYATEKNGK